jgi:hypothetical protein
VPRRCAAASEGIVKIKAKGRSRSLDGLISNSNDEAGSGLLFTIPNGGHS